MLQQPSHDLPSGLRILLPFGTVIEIPSRSALPTPPNSSAPCAARVDTPRQTPRFPRAGILLILALMKTVLPRIVVSGQQIPSIHRRGISCVSCAVTPPSADGWHKLRVITGLLKKRIHPEAMDRFVQIVGE